MNSAFPKRIRIGLGYSEQERKSGVKKKSQSYNRPPAAGELAGGRKQMIQNRPSWDEYFLEVAHLVSKRATCLRRRVGAVLVKDKKILATGYNGAPSGLVHCFDTGCIREKLKVPSGQRHELCRGLHAEQNVILQAALYGVSSKESTLYLTNQPCVICAKMLINAGIREVVIADGYPDELARKFLKEAKIKIRRIGDKLNSKH